MQIFDGLGIESAAAILNVVVITAAISAINSDIFGAGRMLYGMARQGQAPVGFAGVAARRAVDDRAADGGGPAARRGAELPDPAERIPADRFHRHLRHRVGLADDPPGPGRHAPAHGAAPGRRAEVPGAAVAIRAAAAIVFMLFIFVVLGYFPDTRPALWVGAIWIAVLVIAYRRWVRPKGDAAHGVLQAQGGL